LTDWEASPTTPNTLPTRDQLLGEVARRLWSEAQDYVHRVLPNQPDGAPRPLGEFIIAQGETDPSNFRLPEPLLGPVGETTDVLVVGLNPGYESTEDLPRLDASLEDYIAWYADRMAPERRLFGRPASRFANVTRIIRHS